MLNKKSGNGYYYYDPETLAFVEAQPSRKRGLIHVALVLGVSLVLGTGVFWGISKTMGTPQEAALQAENTALSEQLKATLDRMAQFQGQLNQLVSTEDELYRATFGVDPISEDVRQLGTGGADAYEQFEGFGSSTLLQQVAQMTDQLELQLNLQNDSYRELMDLARDRREWLEELPAILPTEGRLTSGFGMRFHPILKKRRPHNGVDIVVPTGTPIYATGDGVISVAGRNSGLGIHVKIQHPRTGYMTVYAHLSKIPDQIKVGRRVERGELIGLSGNTGLSRAPHLHYEVRSMADNTALNPVRFFMPSLTPTEYAEIQKQAEQTNVPLDWVE